jgi:hypothetical protein
VLRALLICLCNHQTLIVAAMGLEIFVLMADRRVGRDFLLLNTAFWILGLSLHASGKIRTFADNPALLLIFNLVGILSAIGTIWTAVLTGAIATRLHIVLLSGISFGVGAAHYFYMPLASVTNPPLNWGYPRVWDGFVHAFTRGQYEKTTPGITPDQISAYFGGVKEEFNLANLIFAIVPFLLIKRFRPRERGWLIGLSTTYFCLAFLLIYLLNAQTDKQSRELVKVFYTSSHVMIAMVVGYGIAIVGVLLQHAYQKWRTLLLAGATIAVSLNLYQLIEVLNPEKNVFFLPRLAAEDR